MKFITLIFALLISVVVKADSPRWVGKFHENFSIIQGSEDGYKAAEAMSELIDIREDDLSYYVDSIPNTIYSKSELDGELLNCLAFKVLTTKMFKANLALKNLEVTTTKNIAWFRAYNSAVDHEYADYEAKYIQGQKDWGKFIKAYAERFSVAALCHVLNSNGVYHYTAGIACGSRK